MEAIRVPAAFPSPADVQGRRIVITGASRGLGRVIATGLARAGARVALVSRDRDALAALAAELPAALMRPVRDRSGPTNRSPMASIA